ncbi:MAG: hypothetical protein CL814_13880 [Confluentimicrobium sp.]|uniref:TadE/TadG family type IV pilus assembly protein n=1 Tax=Actibacterium sp. TaxID=1872125 RepID=UPI000C465A8C|nr:hypothetical protein [Actibacterium sp.]MBC56092.1 hypothetical protein [Actibacterium sp.]MBC58008.1 hypothetical protein [Actibacterium sp.]
MMGTICKRLRRFIVEEDATITAEAVMTLPVLVWTYVGSLAFFDAYDAKNVNQKAAYTISDMLSRETAPVNALYIQGLANTYDYLTSGHGTDSRIRVTIVRCADNCANNDASRVMTRDWSYGTGTLAPLTDGDLSSYLDVIPIMPAGDRVILVETFVTYTPAFNVGLDQRSFENTVVTRPRFMATIPWG